MRQGQCVDLPLKKCQEIVNGPLIMQQDTLLV